MVRIFLTYQGRNGRAEVEAREAAERAASAEREGYESASDYASSSPIKRPSKRIRSSMKKGKQRAVATPTYHHDPNDDLEADLMEALETPPATPYSHDHHELDPDETDGGDEVEHDFTMDFNGKLVHTNRAKICSRSLVIAETFQDIPLESGFSQMEESMSEGLTAMTMEVFALWIDTGRIHIEKVLRNHKVKVVRFDDDSNKPPIDPHYDLLVDSHFLSDTIKCISFQNAIMDALVAYFHVKYERTHTLPLNNFNRISQGVLPSSPLRKFVVDLLHFWCTPDQLKRYVEAGYVPTAILISITMDAMVNEEAGEGCAAPWQLDRSDYHVWESE